MTSFDTKILVDLYIKSLKHFNGKNGKTVSDKIVTLQYWCIYLNISKRWTNTLIFRLKTLVKRLINNCKVTNFDNLDFDDVTLASKVKKLPHWIRTMEHSQYIFMYIFNTTYYKSCAYLMYAWNITIYLIIQWKKKLIEPNRVKIRS